MQKGLFYELFQHTLLVLLNTCLWPTKFHQFFALFFLIKNFIYHLAQI